MCLYNNNYRKRGHGSKRELRENGKGWGERNNVNGVHIIET